MLVVPVARVFVQDGAAAGKSVAVATAAAAMGGTVEAPVLAALGEEERAARSWAADRLTVRVHTYEPENAAQGPAVPREAWTAYVALVEEAVARAAADEDARQRPWLLLAGSLPPGAPAHAWQEVIPRAKEQGVRVAVDLRGEVLGAAVAGGPDLVRLDASHAGTALGRKILTVEDAAWAAGQYDVGLEGRVVAITGMFGVVLVDGDGSIHTQPPSGPLDADALLAALAMTMTGGIDADTALMLAVGAAQRDSG